MFCHDNGVYCDTRMMFLVITLNIIYFIFLQVLDFDGVGKPAEYMCSNQFPLSTLQEAHSTSDKLELREGSI